jgi:hypothetical protein
MPWDIANKLERSLIILFLEKHLDNPSDETVKRFGTEGVQMYQEILRKMR